MKTIAIWKHFSCFTTSSDQIESNEIDEKVDGLNQELRSVFEKYGFSMLYNEGRFIPLEKMSAGYCQKCGNLMINRDKNPSRFDNDPLYSDLEFVVLNGGNHEGQELCEECLPIGHRWGHFS